jgi:uncharacterized membrane protein YraQ (UPF0718 family)
MRRGEGWLSVLVLGTAVLALAAIGSARDSTYLPRALESTGRLLRGVWPELALGFLLAGLIDAAIPAESIRHWLGGDRPARAISVGWAVGLVVPGGPYLLFPLAAKLLGQGASAGAVMALVASKTLVSPIRLVTYEAPLLGWTFSLARLLPTLFVPLLVGWLGHLVFTALTRR